MSLAYVGIDIGCESHYLYVMNEFHEPLIQRKLKQSIREISKFIEELKALNFDEVLVGMEGSGGYAAPLDRILADAGFKVVAINPRALDQFRKLTGQDRKDDPYDAYLICKYLIDIYQGQGREKNAQAIDKPGKSSLGNLRILTRQLRTTKRDLTRTSHRLKKHVLGYFPDFFEVFPDLKTSTARILLKYYGSISKIKRTREKTIANTRLSSKRRIGPKAAAKLKALVSEIQYSDPLEDSMWQVTQNLVDQSTWLMDKSEDLEKQIDKLAQSSKSIQLIAGQISGAGIQSAAELLAEIGDIKRFSDREKLSLYCGIGALNHSSGKSINAKKPTQVNHRTKGVICMMAMSAIVHDKESRRYYDKKRGEGKSHWHAIKCLSKYLLRRVFRLLIQLENQRNLAQAA
jgi:transposase